ncbi:MAG: DinB family protein [Actinobacteria bacterium]|nr:DinB family protein [Actinomycetota bacterium]
MTERPVVPRDADERTVLTATLAWLRSAVVHKASGVDRDIAIGTATASGLDLLGVVRHLAYTERFWFRWAFAGEDVELPWSDEVPDADFQLPPGWSAEDVIAFYREECAASDAVVAAASDLGQLCARERRPTSLRWVLVHMIRETARHAGHADIFREHIDGLVGE